MGKASIFDKYRGSTNWSSGPFSETSFAGHFPILFDDCPIEFPEADEDDSWEVEFMSRLEEISRKDQRRGEMGMALAKSKKSRDSW